jgi:6-phosphogluconolactonase
MLSPKHSVKTILSMRFFLLSSILFVSLSGVAQHDYLFIGTYTLGNKNVPNGSKGIYVYDFDAATGDVKPVSTINTENPSYLALAPKGDFLYAVNETDGDRPGGVSAFGFDKASGELKFLDRQASGGDDPCYVSVDARRKWLMVANYNGGNCAALPIETDGSIGAIKELIQHTGTGPIPQRQEKAHVHSATFSPDDHFLLVADLGMDKLSVYRFYPNAPAYPLTSPNDSVVTIGAGSGPRHISFYPGKPWVYLLNEMGGTVDAFHYHEGRLEPFQHISSHPAGFSGVMGSADIHVAPGGKFLYASNRGDANSIAIFAIDTTSGTLTVKGFQSVLGTTPRNFIIDPTGHWLLVANQNSNNIVIFNIDEETGLLKPSGKQIQLPAPVCLKMLSR